MWLLSTQNVAKVSGGLSFSFYLFLINLHFNYYTSIWLVATLLDPASLGH